MRVDNEHFGPPDEWIALKFDQFCPKLQYML